MGLTGGSSLESSKLQLLAELTESLRGAESLRVRTESADFERRIAELLARRAAAEKSLNDARNAVGRMANQASQRAAEASEAQLRALRAPMTALKKQLADASAELERLRRGTPIDQARGLDLADSSRGLKGHLERRGRLAVVADLEAAVASCPDPARRELLHLFKAHQRRAFELGLACEQLDPLTLAENKRSLVNLNGESKKLLVSIKAILGESKRVLPQNIDPQTPLSQLRGEVLDLLKTSLVELESRRLL